MRATILLCAVLAGVPALAGESYRFVLKIDAAPVSERAEGTVWTDGDGYRLEFSELDMPKLGYDVAIREDGQGEILLDLEQKTYYAQRGELQPTARHFRLLQWGEHHIRNLTAEFSADGEEVLGDWVTHRQTIELAYDAMVKFPGDAVRGRVRLRATFWTVEHNLPLPELLRPQVLSGLEEIDELLALQVAKLVGFPVRQEIVVEREILEGSTDSYRRSIELSQLAQAVDEEKSFRIPEGFIYREPVFSGPLR